MLSCWWAVCPRHFFARKCDSVPGREKDTSKTRPNEPKFDVDRVQGVATPCLFAVQAIQQKAIEKMAVTEMTAVAGAPSMRHSLSSGNGYAELRAL